MRYLNILLILMQKVIEQRMKALIWFLMTLLNPVVLILFWQGALKSTGGSIESWTQSDFNSYYLILIVVSNILVIHIEEHISFYDINLGYLSGFLVRPFSYYWMMFFHEMPYRILEGVYGIVAVFLISLVFHGLTFFNPTFSSILLVSIILVCALFISFTFKVIIGLLALWFTQVEGLRDTVFILGLVFGGFIVPLEILPQILKNIMLATPFPWITYYPVIALQGRIDTTQMTQVISQQLAWLVGLYLVHQFIWKRGIKKFTAVGQ